MHPSCNFDIMEVFKRHENLKFTGVGNLPISHADERHKLMIQLKLYGTEGCHLCDHALELVQQTIASNSNITLQYMDIIDDEELMNAYGLIIPVLSLDDHTRLSWPFSVEEITEFIERCQ